MYVNSKVMKRRKNNSRLIKDCSLKYSHVNVLDYKMLLCSSVNAEKYHFLWNTLFPRRHVKHVSENERKKKRQFPFNCSWSIYTPPSLIIVLCDCP